jgi:hypothetical protein
MLYVVIGTSAGKPREEIMAVYPRHKAFLDAFVARGEVVGVGPFVDGAAATWRSSDPRGGRCVREGDPFALEGLVREYQVKEWGDQMLS